MFAGALALLTTLGSMAIMLVATTNKTMTGAGLSFYILSAMLFASCTGSAFSAEKRQNPIGAVAFAVTNAALFLVFFSFFIHDAADKRCDDNVWQLLPCAEETTHEVECGCVGPNGQERLTIVVPGAPQNVEVLVFQYLAALCLYVLFVTAGVRRSREMRFSLDTLNRCGSSEGSSSSDADSTS